MLTTDVSLAVAALRVGRLVAVPTETVYGLAADACDPEAVGRIYAVKGRPPSHPVIVHVATASALDAWAQEIPPYARVLADGCWPGPLTLVLPRSARAGHHVTGGADTVGLRCPDHPLTRQLIADLADDGSAGVAAPSANRFGRVSPTTAADVVREIGPLLTGGDLVLDGGRCPVGVESTIVDATGPRPRLLRPGAVTAERVAALTGLDVLEPDGAVRAPGMLASHYAPQARVVVCEPTTAAVTLAALSESATEIGLIALAEVRPATTHRRLAEPADVDSYARELYSALRSADEHHLDVVVAVLPPTGGLGTAIRDRLRRAAAGSHPEAP